MPLVRPVTVWVVAVELKPVRGLAGLPDPGGDLVGDDRERGQAATCHDTVAWLFPAVAGPMIGGGSATQPVNVRSAPRASGSSTATLHSRDRAARPDPRVQARVPTHRTPTVGIGLHETQYDYTDITRTEAKVPAASVKVTGYRAA